MAEAAPDLSVCFGPRAEEFEGSIGLRIGAIFILLASSAFTTLFPIVTRKVPRCNIPDYAYDFAKYFGAGVIIATAFIHLLAPGVEALSSPCLNSDFQSYPMAFAFSLIALFLTFIVEVVAFRVGRAKAASLAYDPHAGGHHHATEHAMPIPKSIEEGAHHDSDSSEAAAAHPHKLVDDDAHSVNSFKTRRAAATSEILGVAILEFGVIFHSVIIGLTLGTTNDFKILFIVIIFHQMFEGLGLGSRLALLPLRPGSPLPYIGALAYAAVTPIGLAIGLGVRNTYNESAAKAAYITGTFDSVSSGILLYTGTVELLAHEFIFNEKMKTAPAWKLALNISEMMLGAGLMALLGKWA